MIWFLAGAVAASVAALLVLLLALMLLWPAHRKLPAPPAGEVHGPLTQEQLAQLAAHREIAYRVFDTYRRQS